MKILLSVLAVLLLAGCTTEVVPARLQVAASLCATHGGVEHFLINVDSFNPEVTCADGAWFDRSVTNAQWNAYERAE